jgi:hypothetical protein
MRKTHFFAENWQKSQKIMIIKSTPGWAKLATFYCLFVIFDNLKRRIITGAAADPGSNPARA